MELHLGPLCVRGLSRVEFVPDNDELRCDMDMSIGSENEKVLHVHVPLAWKDVLSDMFICSSSFNQRKVDASVEPQEEEGEVKEQVSKPRPKRRLKRRIESEEEDEGEEEPRNVIADYSVASDTNVWSSLDHVHYQEESDTTRDELLYLDMHGNEIKTALEHTEFIVTPEGEVCSVNGAHFAMFSCWERGRLVYAPGKPHKMTTTGGEICLTIEWLKPSRQLASPHPTSLEEIVLREHFSLPATAFCANLEHLCDKTRDNHMSEYHSTLRALRCVVSRPKLGAWARETGAKQDETSGADLMDLLEFRFIKPQWIWRSCLGVYIWTTFLRPVIEFGLKPNLPLVESVLNAPEFEQCEIPEKTNCDACGKRDVVKNRVSIGTQTYDVGCVCLSRMRYIHQVANHIRNARHSDFKHATNICLKLSMLQKAYLEEQDDFKQLFASQ